MDAPSVARLAGGGNVVAWVEGGSVRARLTDAAGALVGDPFTVGALVNHAAGQSVTAAPDGGFLVLWIVETEKAQSQFSGSVGIRARKYSANGTAQWETLVSDGTQQVLDRAVARATPNGFVVGWTLKALFPMPSQGAMRLLAADGTPVGSPVAVSQTDGAQQLSVAPLQDGSFLAVWRSFLSNSAVYTRRFDAALVPIAPGLPVPGTESATDVSAETLADGNVGLAWSAGANEVRSAVLSPVGTLVSAPQVSATRLAPSSLAVLPFGTSGFGVAWQVLDGNYRSNSAEIWLRHFALAGTALDEPVQVESRLTFVVSGVTGASVTAGSGYGICSGPDGHFVAAFQRAGAQADTYLMGR